MKPVTAASVASFVIAFAGSVALWWLYFDQSAGAAAEMRSARSDDPGPGDLHAAALVIAVAVSDRAAVGCPARAARVSPPESQASRDTREAHSYLFRLKWLDG